MSGFSRYAVYYTPTGGLARFGAAWLGWDAEAGQAVEQPVVAGLDMAALTEAPRRYGFHATMKAPFRLADGRDAAGLAEALARFCAAQAPFALAGGLRLARLGGFLALIPSQDSAPLSALEAALVRDLDPFRAPLTAAERARRHPERLSPQGREALDRWGYPHVMAAFRFHMTLTGDLDPATADRAEAALRPRLADLIGGDQPIDALSLMGEEAEGRFHLIRRVALG